MKIIKHLFYVKVSNQTNLENQTALTLKKLVYILFFVKDNKMKPMIHFSSPIFFIIFMGISIAIIFCSSIYFSTSTIHAQFTETQIEQTQVPPSLSDDNILLNLLSVPTASIQTTLQTELSTNNIIQANPFATKKSVVIENDSEDSIEEVIQLNSFEYRVDAIWKINDKYKALISGHIVNETDVINTIEIVKIDKTSITIKKNRNIHSFELGQVFYDYEL